MNKKNLLQFLCSIFLCIFTFGDNNYNDHEHILRYQLKRRHGILKQIALTAKNPLASDKNCPNTRLLITEYAFGRSGNNLIEFSHGLWLAKRLNATLVVPTWMREIFTPFDTSFIESIFCYTFDTTPPKDATVYEMTSENSFFLYQLKKEFKYPEFIPEIMKIHFKDFESSDISDSFIQELSKHFVQVYAALWSSPIKKLMLLAEFYLLHFLKGSLSYSSAHKRQLEGGCAKVLATVTKPTDFSSKEIPLYHSDWFTYPLHKFHPICEMTPSFLQETLSINHRNKNLSNIFIAYDGRGDISSYEKEHVLFSHYLTNYLTDPNSPSANAILQHNISVHVLHKLQAAIGSSSSSSDTKNNNNINDLLKYLDMLIAIHSEFFILNPRSTFSFQIYVIRVCLGLQSVPIIRENDFYMQKYPDEWKNNDRNIWVSWISILQAAADIPVTANG